MDKLLSIIFNSNSSWICPAGVTKIIVYGAGGGAGGAGGLNGSVGAGGNGTNGGLGQSLQPVLLDVVPNTTYSITIGAGGNGAASNSVAASSGGDTTFGALFTWKGAPGADVSSGTGSPYVFGVYSSDKYTSTDMSAYPIAGMGGVANSNANRTTGFAGSSWLTAAFGNTALAATTGGNSGSGMSGIGIGGTGGGGGTAGNAGTAGGNAAANSSAGGGAGGAGGSSSAAGGIGGNGGSGQLIIMYVE